MLRIPELVFGPVTEALLDLGVRLEFLVPTVAVLSMGAGILTARLTERWRQRANGHRGSTRT